MRARLLERVKRRASKGVRQTMCTKRCTSNDSKDLSTYRRLFRLAAEAPTLLSMPTHPKTVPSSSRSGCTRKNMPASARRTGGPPLPHRQGRPGVLRPPALETPSMPKTSGIVLPNCQVSLQRGSLGGSTATLRITRSRSTTHAMCRAESGIRCRSTLSARTSKARL